MTATMVGLVVSREDGTGGRQVYYQPWEIDRIEAWMIGPTACQEQGARLLITSDIEGGESGYVYCQQSAHVIARSVDRARAGALTDPLDVQRVVVTNWMSQIWVLLLVNMIVNLFLSRWMQNVGHCLLEYTCDYPYWWLP